MFSRMPARRSPPVAFARGGAPRLVAPNTSEAFSVALRLGATGIATGLWLSADHRAVVALDGSTGGRLRRRSVGSVVADDLPTDVPLLAELLGLRDDVDVSLDVGDPEAAIEAIAVARDAGAEDRLWLCHREADTLSSWRDLSPTVQLVLVTRLKAIKHGPERLVADLRKAGVDGLRLPCEDWSAGLVAMVHRFDRLALASDAQFERTIAAVVRAGVDAVYGDHPDLLAAAIGHHAREGD